MADLSTTAYLLLDVAGAACAIRGDTVREILPQPHLHEPPTLGGPHAGYLNLGGSAIPVIDLAVLFGLRASTEPQPYRHLVLAADGAVAVMVDRVVDLVRVPSQSIRGIDEAQTFNGCVEAELALGERLVHALSLKRILSVEERKRLDSQTRRAAERLDAFAVAPAL